MAYPKVYSIVALCFWNINRHLIANFSLFLGQQACKNPVSKVDRCMDSTQIAFKFERCPNQPTDSRGTIYLFITIYHKYVSSLNHILQYTV